MFDPCERYHRGADTSVEAFRGLPAETIREEVYRAIRDHGGLACEEVEDRLKMPHQTASARITELLAQGRLRISKRQHKTRSGRSARVYEAVVGVNVHPTSPISEQNQQQPHQFELFAAAPVSMSKVGKHTTQSRGGGSFSGGTNDAE